MTEKARKNESKVKAFVKSIFTIILVIILFFGMQSFIAGIALGVELSNQIISGELPYEIIYDSDQLITTILETAEKVDQSALQISLVSNLLTILILCLSYTIRRKSPTDGMDVKSIGIVRSFSLIIFGMALQVFMVVIIAFIPVPPDISDQHAEVYNTIYSTKDIIMQIISGGVVTGIAEELVFRGIITNHLRRYMHPAIAVTISAIMFGMLHPTVLSMAYATVLGLVLGALYIKYDSVVPSILCHVAFNSMSCLLALVTEETSIIILLLFGTSIPLLIFLTKSIFVRYPTAGDLLFDDKGRIKPKSLEEAEIIVRLRRLKESGQITEKDFKQIDRDWEMAKKARKHKHTTVHKETIIPDNTVTENKGDSDNNETL